MLEIALAPEGPLDNMLAEEIRNDILAYLRTVRPHQIEGASGYRHLKADIEERAAIRSGGLVKTVLVRSLLFE
jgi:flagellar FliL protein